MQRLKLVRNLYNLYFKLFVLSLSVLLSACGGSAVKSSKDDKPKAEASSSVRDSFSQALIFMNDEKYEEAIELLDKINEQNNRLAGVHANLGIAYGKLNQYDEARQALETAVSFNSTSPEILNEMAIAYRNSGNYSAAKESYEKILEAEPNNEQAYLNLGILCDIYMADTACALENYNSYEAIYAAAIPVVTEAVVNEEGEAGAEVVESKEPEKEEVVVYVPKLEKNEKVVQWIKDLEKRK